MYSDPIADFLTRIRNAQKARHRIVSLPSSKIKVGIANVLKDQGYILNYKFVEDNKQGILKVALKYDPITKQPAISRLERVSRPGLRVYKGRDSIPQVMNGLGVAIVTTPKGVMTDRKARATGVGGEVLCYVA